jgi:hypothetical protein
MVWREKSVKGEETSLVHRMGGEEVARRRMTAESGRWMIGIAAIMTSQ